MNIRHYLNDEENITTRRIRGDRVSCSYTGEYFDYGDIAISVSDPDSNHNIWLDITKIDDFCNALESVDEEDIELGLDLKDCVEIGEHSRVYKNKYDNKAFKCHYCCDLHRFDGETVFLFMYRPKLNNNNYIFIHGDCFDDFVNSLKSVPKKLSTSNIVDRI